MAGQSSRGSAIGGGHLKTCAEGPSSSQAARGARPLKERKGADSPCGKRWWKRRGRVKMVLWPAAETSGRRLAAWGDLHATLVHFRIGLAWYLGASPEEMADLYRRLYTDAYR